MTKKDELLTWPRGLEITEFGWDLLKRGEAIHPSTWDEVQVGVGLEEDGSIYLYYHGGDVRVRIPPGVDLAIAEIVLRLQEEKDGQADSG